MNDILSVSDLSKSFGAVTVADEQTFSVAKGEALGIIGPNGAGKTSLFNLITGTLAPNSGTITYCGENVTKHPAAKRCKNGIARSFQVPQPFSGMTVFENALVAATQSANLRGQAAYDLCLEVLEQTELLPKANVQAGQLTLLDRKRLELTRALCSRPKLLLLDEIAGGLTENECQSLIETVKSIHADGVTIIWIEHVVHALLAVVDRLIVIDFGRIVANGDPNDTMNSNQVREIYLGIDADV